ncbi:MAG: hypothetical protein ACRD0F_02395, partial [Acidimicrobiales bacterium]
MTGDDDGAAPPFGRYSCLYVIWLPGASCTGCTVAANGGAHPSLEQMLVGAIPGLPRIELVHTLTSMESGDEWMDILFRAERGELGFPYVLTWEGSVLDESRAGAGFWMGLGLEPGTGRQLTSREWLDRLAPGAEAVIAVGTCATWGGVPAARGNPTGATGVGAQLGPGWISRAGVPLINVPGCAPAGDDYLETLAAVCLHLNGLAPRPELDGLGRPAWLYADLGVACNRAGDLEGGRFAAEIGGSGCLAGLGCAGEAVQCSVAERGMVWGQGGCMSMGGICIGCSMPGFPDQFRLYPEHRPAPPAPLRRNAAVRRWRHRPRATPVTAVPRGTCRALPASRFYRRPGPAPA